MKKHIELKYNIKALCLWEQLQSRSYQTISLTDDNDLSALLYAMYLAGGNEAISQSVFLKTLESGDLLRKYMRQAREQIALSNTLATEQSEGDNQEDKVTASEAHTRLTELISYLIIEGRISADYAMYKMEIWELNPLIKAIERKRLDSLEDSRLWTYLLLSPYIDHKKVPSPKDLITLPHEVSERAKELALEKEIVDLLFEQLGRKED